MMTSNMECSLQHGSGIQLWTTNSFLRRLIHLNSAKNHYDFCKDGMASAA